MSQDSTVLGELCPEGAGRDAVHVAVLPIEAGEELGPGDKVRVMDGCAYGWSSGEGLVGVVDPYLDQIVRGGQRFYLFLLPRTITGLRHVWEHPDFPAEAPISAERGADELYVARAAEMAGYSYDRFLQMCEGAARDNDSVNTGDNECYDVNTPELWDAVARLTGARHQNRDHAYFSCAC
jgi:hypothetical protein